MKLLICTQIIDKNDPILGFFHRWVEEFAKYFEHIYVICLKEGQHALPQNVTVYSLGKEGGENLFKYIIRFYKYLFLLRGAYDRIFVHMNPHYIILGGIFWTYISKHIPIFFWRNHARMNLMTQIAARFSAYVFFTSPFACTSIYPHARKMPVGIDTNIFIPSNRKEMNNGELKKILFLGRLSPVKRVELFIEIAQCIPHGYEFHIYGDDPTKGQRYVNVLKKQAPYNVFFHPSVKNDVTPEIYRSHDVYVNLTPEGSMDKTVLEAASCGVTVLVSNTSFSGIVPQTSVALDISPQILAEKIVFLTNQDDKERRRVAMDTRDYIIENHSLEKLATMLYNYMK